MIERRRVLRTAVLLALLWAGIAMPRAAAQAGDGGLSAMDAAFSDLLRFVPEVEESYVFATLPHGMIGQKAWAEIMIGIEPAHVPPGPAAPLPHSYELFLKAMLGDLHGDVFVGRPITVLLAAKSFRLEKRVAAFAMPEVVFESVAVVRTADSLRGKMPEELFDAKRDGLEFCPDDRTFVKATTLAAARAARRAAGRDFRTTLSLVGLDASGLREPAPFLLLRRLRMPPKGEAASSLKSVLFFAHGSPEDIFECRFSGPAIDILRDEFLVILFPELTVFPADESIAEPDRIPRPSTVATLDLCRGVRIVRRSADSAAARVMDTIFFLGPLFGVTAIF